MDSNSISFKKWSYPNSYPKYLDDGGYLSLNSGSIHETRFDAKMSLGSGGTNLYHFSNAKEFVKTLKNEKKRSETALDWLSSLGIKLNEQETFKLAKMYLRTKSVYKIANDLSGFQQYEQKYDELIKKLSETTGRNMNDLDSKIRKQLQNELKKNNMILKIA